MSSPCFLPLTRNLLGQESNLLYNLFQSVRQIFHNGEQVVGIEFPLSRFPGFEPGSQIGFDTNSF